LSTDGYAGPARPIKCPSGSAKWPTTRSAPGFFSGPHSTRAAEALGLLERSLDVRNADVEDHVALVAHPSPTPPGIPVVLRSRSFPAGKSPPRPGVRIELPSEQVAVVAPELLRILPDDFEMHNWLSHGQVPSEEQQVSKVVVFAVTVESRSFTVFICSNMRRTKSYDQDTSSHFCRIPNTVGRALTGQTSSAQRPALPQPLQPFRHSG
jgi:hypothetical protein